MDLSFFFNHPVFLPAMDVILKGILVPSSCCYDKNLSRGPQWGSTDFTRKVTSDSKRIPDSSVHVVNVAETNVRSLTIICKYIISGSRFEFSR